MDFCGFGRFSLEKSGRRGGSAEMITLDGEMMMILFKSTGELRGRVE